MGKFGNEFWNEKFSTDEYIYGLSPNKFFKEQIKKFKPGKLLLLGEGEGRNSVYTASKGWEVDAADFSQTAKEKALKLAEKNNVTINYTISNVGDFIPRGNYYDAVGLVFIHLNPEERKVVHKRMVTALKNKGQIILQAFEKEQLGKNSGGPQSEEMLYSIEELENDFRDLRIHLLKKESVFLEEGNKHYGGASVIKFVGEKVEIK
jgi:2-polyprenyl-3-methyl-5-hydroxy-6-metoxy-1,4-benzoquinol methylase